MAVNDYPSIHSGNTIDTRVSQVATNTADIAALKARMNEAEEDLEGKADATSVTAVNSRVGGVEAKIPSSATTSNKLVDKAYLDNALAGKVDVNGSKGLSTNDFTNDYKTKLDGLPTGQAISNALDGKVNTEQGKGLSTNDYTDSEKTKLAGINNGAQANVLEAVKVGGTALTITNKAVNIELVTTTDIDALF